jgi:hypothetical protein
MLPGGSVLALDMARALGWCAGEPGARPHYGRVALNGQTRAHAYAALLDYLEDAIALHRPARIVAEAPLSPQAQRSEDAALLLFGLRAQLELFAFDKAIPVAFVPFHEPRGVVLGRSNFPKGQAKIAAMTWCEAHGFSPSDDNVADALILWHHATGWRRQPGLAA